LDEGIFNPYLEKYHNMSGSKSLNNRDGNFSQRNGRQLQEKCIDKDNDSKQPKSTVIIINSHWSIALLCQVLA
jgi:hypothetical protein